MGIAPVTKLSLAQILVAHVESAHITNAAIYDHQLTMISKIHTEVQIGNEGWKEYHHAAARLPQSFEKVFFHRHAAHAIGEQAHIHAFSCLLAQNIHHLISQFISPKNIVLNINILCSLTQICQQTGELILTIGKNIHIVIVADHRLTAAEQHAQGIHIPLILFIAGPPGIDHRTVLSTVDAPPLNIGDLIHVFRLLGLKHLSLTQILPHIQIHNETQNRRKKHDQQPGPQGTGIFTLKKHQQYTQQNIKPEHILGNICPKIRKSFSHFAPLS